MISLITQINPQLYTHSVILLCIKQLVSRLKNKIRVTLTSTNVILTRVCWYWSTRWGARSRAITVNTAGIKYLKAIRYSQKPQDHLCITGTQFNKQRELSNRSFSAENNPAAYPAVEWTLSSSRARTAIYAITRWKPALCGKTGVTLHTCWLDCQKSIDIFSTAVWVIAILHYRELKHLTRRLRMPVLWLSFNDPRQEQICFQFIMQIFVIFNERKP